MKAALQLEHTLRKNDIAIRRFLKDVGGIDPTTFDRWINGDVPPSPYSIEKMNILLEVLKNVGF